jgi:hypothetical protein
MAQGWIDWQPISTAPDTGEQILTGFMGQYKWMSFVDPAFGPKTGEQQQHAKPTHWAPIDPPHGLEK